MDKQWTAGLNELEAQELRQQIKESYYVLVRLEKLLEADISKSVQEMRKKDNYLMPAWSQYQASRLGEQAALARIVELVQSTHK